METIFLISAGIFFIILTLLIISSIIHIQYVILR